MIVGCLTPIFFIFLIWGSRLSTRSGDINQLNKSGNYQAAMRVSNETRKMVNKALIAAVAAAALTLGPMAALQYKLIG